MHEGLDEMYGIAHYYAKMVADEQIMQAVNFMLLYKFFKQAQQTPQIFVNRWYLCLSPKVCGCIY